VEVKQAGNRAHRIRDGCKGPPQRTTHGVTLAPQHGMDNNGWKETERAKAKGITTVVFDTSGLKYHGRVAALAAAAREAGLEF